MARAGRVDNGASMEVSKVEPGRILNCRFAGKMFPAVMVKNCHSARSEESAVPGSLKERDSSLRSE